MTGPSADGRGLSGPDRIRSAYHGFWLAVSERVRFQRGPPPLRASGRLPPLAPAQAARVRELAARYGRRIEDERSPATALANYEVLHLLDAAFAAWGLPSRRGGTLHDVGCASFWYAPALAAFFAPAALVGIEVEGYRLLAGLRSRRDHARANITGVNGARFEVADYARFAEPAEVVTAFFPFVTPRPVLAWRLPLSVLAPEALFARIAGNLRPGGQLVLFSHGHDEARLAIDIAMGAGLRQVGAATGLDPLVSRPQPPVATLWTAAGPSRP